MKTGTFPIPLLRKSFLLFLALFLTVGMVSAQGEQISWDDDDEDEEEAAPVMEKYDEAVIMLDGKEIPISDYIEVNREDTLSIHVERLLPNSWVAVHIEKGKMDVVKRRFQCNEKGELDLEVRTGKRKVSGNATLYYAPSNGVKKDRKVKVKVL